MPLKTMVKTLVHVLFVWRLATVLSVVAVIVKTSAEPKALTVTFTNATTTSLQLQPVANANGQDAAACCKPLTGEVSTFDTSLAMYSGSKCETPTKLCSFPAAVQSVWVCGCSGNKCYGRRAVSSKSPLVGLINNRSTITSSEPLFTYHGFPVAVQVFSGPTSRSVPCSIKGVTVIYKGSMLTLGQSTPSLSVAKLWGVTDDPITHLAYQSADRGCIDYLELRTKAGRVLRAGSHNSSMPLESLSGEAAESSLAGLIGFSKPTADVVAAQGQLTGLKAIWGHRSCPAAFQAGTTAGVSKASPTDPAVSVAVAAPQSPSSPPAAAAAAAQENVTAPQTALGEVPTAAPTATATTAQRAAAAANAPPQAAAAAPTAAAVATTAHAAVAAAATNTTTVPPKATAAAAAAAAPAAPAAAAPAAVAPKAAPAPVAVPAAVTVPAAAEATTPQPKAGKAVDEMQAAAAFPANSAATVTAPAAAPAAATPTPMEPAQRVAAAVALHPAAATAGKPQANTSLPAAAVAVAAVHRAPPSSSVVAAPSRAADPAQQAAASTPRKAASTAAAAAGPLPKATAKAAAAAGMRMAAAKPSTAAAVPSTSPPQAATGAPHAVPAPLASPAAAATPKPAVPEHQAAALSPQKVVAAAVKALTSKAATVLPATGAAKKALALPLPAAHTAPSVATAAFAAAAAVPVPSTPFATAVAAVAAANNAAAEAAEAAAAAARAAAAAAAAVVAAAPQAARMRIGGTSLADAAVLELPAAYERPLTNYSSCGMSDPHCFSDAECYCRLPNGTYGAACPLYGSCFGACCATNGVCPSKMGYQNDETGEQRVLQAKTCADWGLDKAGSTEMTFPRLKGNGTHNSTSSGRLQSIVSCRIPTNRVCDPTKPGALCTGYTECRRGHECRQELYGAMCVFRPDGSSRFDVCSCMPVYPVVDPSDVAPWFT